MTHHVFLIPGFFGFSSLGRLKYFAGVAEVMRDELDRAGVPSIVREIDTLPTASIRQRAAHLLDFVEQSVESSAGPIHLVGHSTGGLDARLLICPTADLSSRGKRELFERVQTLVTVATPHHGTPLASTFGGAFGRPMLKLIAVLLVYLLTHGKLPLRIGLLAGSWVTRLDDRLGLKHTVADRLFESLLAELGEEERHQLLQFLEGVGNDQSLLFQLTEAGCDLLNATTGKPENIRFGSILTSARSARLTNLRAYSHNVYAQTLHALFAALHLMAGRTDERWLPPVQGEFAAQLHQRLGRPLSPRDNDGVVPTFSQIWGEHIGIYSADHLDVVGHYEDAANGADWFPSRSGFDREQFEALWRSVARFILPEPQRRAFS